MGKSIHVTGALLAGVIIGMLFAPKSGRETREDLTYRAKDMKDKAAEKADRFKQAAREGAAVAKSGAKRINEEVRATNDEAMERAKAVAKSPR